MFVARVLCLLFILCGCSLSLFGWCCFTVVLDVS